MPTVRYRAVLDFEIDVQDVSMERIRERYLENVLRRAEASEWWDVGEPPELPEPPTEEHVQDLQDLVQALRSRPDVLDAWIKDVILVHLEFSGLEEAHPMPKREELLLPLVETLPARQRHRFREMIAKDRFWWDADDFYDCFGCTIRNIAVEAVE